MKFAHMSDVHLGSWSNHPDMKDLPVKAFEKAINECIIEKIDFLLIAGDLFDTSMPHIEALKSCASLLRKCRDADIRVYIVPGSHDYSPTGKTMLSVMENAGLLKDVSIIEKSGDKIKLVFTHDESGAKICGILGKMGALEKSYYENLDESASNEEGFKIFVMHSAIEEYSPKNLATTAVPKSLLPRNFNYYANGHVHIRLLEKHEKGFIAFPGPLFPTSFDELEDYDSGFYIIDYDGSEMKINRKKIKLFDVELIKIKKDTTTPASIENEIINRLEKSDLTGKAVLIKVSGVLESGKPGDIDFKKINALAASKGAMSVKKNTSKLSTKEFLEVSANPNMFVEDIEKEIMRKHFSEKRVFSTEKIEELMNSLNDEKAEGETVSDFENRIKANAKKVLQVD